jgi:hypothetical protein
MNSLKYFKNIKTFNIIVSRGKTGSLKSTAKKIIEIPKQDIKVVQNKDFTLKQSNVS